MNDKFHDQLLIAWELVDLLFKILIASVIILAVNAYLMWSYWPLIQHLITWLTR